MSYTTTENGFVIYNTVYRGVSDSPQDSLVHLALQQGDMVVYTPKERTIDFPGEYDIAGMHIVAWADKMQFLHYMITMDKKRITLIQNVQGLDYDGLDGGIAEWYCTSQDIADEIAAREYNGSVNVLSASAV